jgi:hypothetical protein
MGSWDGIFAKGGMVGIMTPLWHDPLGRVSWQSVVPPLLQFFSAYLPVLVLYLILEASLSTVFAE